MSDTINLNPDPLAEFENILRTSGAWCDVIGENKEQHYFLAKNKRSGHAVSLCGTKIKKFSEITRTDVRKKCLVCDLFYIKADKEVNIEVIHERVTKSVKAKMPVYRQVKMFE